MKPEARLFVGTVNGENSISNPKAKTYIHAKSPDRAAMGLWKRYMSIFGKADVTDLEEVNKDTGERSRVAFKLEFNRR